MAMMLILTSLRYHSLGEPLERDLTTYAYISHEMLSGDQLYSDLWDHKPPMIYWIYMAAELIWGYMPEAITYLGIVFSLLSFVFIFLFLMILANGWIALLGASFWSLASNSVLLQANQPNTEIFLNTFTLMGFWSFALYAKTSHRKILFLSGMAFAIASTFKMIAIFPAAALCVYLLFPGHAFQQGKWKRTGIEWGIFLSPVAILWGIIVIIFALSGNLKDFYNVVFVFNRQYSGSLAKNILLFLSEPELLFHRALKEVWVLVLLSIAWLMVSRKYYGPLHRVFFLLVLIGAWMEIASPGRFYAHYYQLLLPISSILAALFFSDVHAALKYRKTAIKAGILGMLLILSLGHLGFYQWNYLQMSPQEISFKKYGHLFLHAHKLAQHIQTLTAPCETIYEFGGETGLYYYAQRKAASGIFQIVSFLHSPQKQQQEMYHRILQDLQSSPPAFFIWNSEFGILEESPFLPFIGEKYHEIATSHSYRIFEYKNRQRPPDC
jgi:hypothetical protein